MTDKNLLVLPLILGRLFSVLRVLPISLMDVDVSIPICSATCGGAKVQVTGHRSGHRLQATGQVTGHRSQVRLQATGHRPQIRLQVTKNNRTLDKTGLTFYYTKIK